VQRVLDDRATSSEQKFKCVVCEDLPTIRGDKNHLVTIFTNLLSNAIKYSSEEDAPYIEIGFTGERRGGKHPVFYVADNGIGIPADQQEIVFNLFSRSSNAAAFRGSGVGLSLVKRILNFHEGDIWLESTYGEGTRFMFYTGV
jgi:signal transduction histidine kinase